LLQKCCTRKNNSHDIRNGSNDWEQGGAEWGWVRLDNAGYEAEELCCGKLDNSMEKLGFERERKKRTQEYIAELEALKEKHKEDLRKKESMGRRE
jgi:hypothetical protein